MSNQATGTTRRSAIKTIGAMGAAAALGTSGSSSDAAISAPEDRATGFARELQLRIQQTPLVDSHEHLPDEDERLRGQQMACDDWALLFSHYANDDWISAGMSDETHRGLLARNVDPAAKWQLLAPFWPAVKHTGYGRAVRIAIQELYGIDQLDAAAIPRLQAGYESVRKAGFYKKILVELARIESCQVNSLGGTPFKESKQPTLLMQDLSILGMHMGPDIKRFAQPTGKKVQGLADWHEVIRWWFDKYAPYAVAVKSQAAYSRGLDYEQVPAEQAEMVFKKILAAEPVSLQEKKLLEDHLFWYAVEQATQRDLPVKIHTGYYAGRNSMPLGRVAENPAQVCELCRKSPRTQWVFMHIAYPYWQDLIVVAKQYRNAHIDMCWSWIIDPVASTEFLKSYLMAAPANKVLVFGGDYRLVECVLGHARMARDGVARVLRGLVEEGYLGREDALDLVEPLLRGNAHRIFALDAKLARLAKAPWI